MERYVLSSASYATLKKVDLSEMGRSVCLVDDLFAIETDDLSLLQTILSEEIAGPGMTDDQMNVNEYGIALEALYDELLFLKYQ